MTSSQIALAWMLSKHRFIVPLFGTTKLSHLEEDLRSADFTLSADEISELEAKVSACPVVGDRGRCVATVASGILMRDRKAPDDEVKALFGAAQR